MTDRLHPIVRQLLLGRRRQQADEAACPRAPHADPTAAAVNVLRHGVARVVSNDDGGDYTITEQWWDGDAAEWADATQPIGHVAAEARDWLQRADGQGGDRVLFWEQRALGGQIELLIDVAAAVVCWGKATADWSSGNEVTLDPCLADGTDIAGADNVTACVVSPTGADPADAGLEPVIAENDVLAYLAFGDDEALLVNVKWQTTAGVRKTADFWIDMQKSGDFEFTLSNEDWRGRTITASCVARFDKSPDQARLWPWNTGEPPEAAQAGRQGDTNSSNGDAQIARWPFGGGLDVWLYCRDGTGRLYLDVYGSPASRWQLAVQVIASGKRTAPTHTAT